MSNTIIFEMVTAPIMSLRDFENSKISAQDILYHILVPNICSY